MAAPFETQNSDGVSWADQWDYKSDDAKTSSSQANQQSSKLAEYNKKVKSAASTGVDKAKTAATVGAKKVKSGTVSSIRWIKDQYQKKTQK